MISGFDVRSTGQQITAHQLLQAKYFLYKQHADRQYINV